MKSNISVIIPTHNRPQSLKRAIQSVVNQTLAPLDIIIVDDVGCLKSKQIADSFSLNNLIYLHSSQEHSASASRNLGAQKAKGDFIAFLDDDDVFLPSKLEKQSKLILKDNLDACFSQILIKYEDSNIEYSTKTRNLSSIEFEILKENCIGGTISAIINRALFLSLGGFDLRFKAREEYDLWIRLIAGGANVGVIEEPLAIAYRSIARRSRISSNINNYVEAIDLINAKYESLVSSRLLPAQLKLRRKMQYNFLAAQAASINLRKESAIYYSKSFTTTPDARSLAGLILSLISPRLLIVLRASL